MIDKECILPVALNAPNNEDMLKGALQEKLADVALVPMVGSEVITDDILPYLGMTREEIFEIAKDNYKNEFPPMLKPLGWLVEMLMPGASEGCIDMPFYVLSTRGLIHGGTMLFIEDYLELVYGFLGCDFYIIPSSVDELIVFPACLETVGDVKSHIYYVNQSICQPEQILSYELFIYRGSEGKVLIAD